MAVDVSAENDFNCHDCDATMMRERGCEEPGIMVFDFDGAYYNRCPVTLVTPLSKEYLRAYKLFSKGILPNGLGWINESNKFLEAMSVIDREIIKIESQKKEK